jgi:hypothetical protein
MTAARTTPVEPAEAILAVLAQLGQATAADTATAAGVAYSTATRNLRELAAAGRVQKLQDGKQTQWRLPTAADTTSVGEPDADHVGPQDTDEPDVATADGRSGTALGTGDQDEATGAPAPGDSGEHSAVEPATPDLATEPGDNPTGAEASTVDAAAAGADVPDGADPPAAASIDTGPDAAPRRASGTLDREVLDILAAHPGQGFKVSQLCKAIDEANQGQDVAKARAGAVVLAAQRLVRKGKAVLAVEKPATFQLIIDPANTGQ